MSLPWIQSLFHTFAAAVFGIGLWYWIAHLRRAQAAFGWIVPIGFAARLVAGVSLFWISYLHLPVARSLQATDGMWFYSLDGFAYIGYSRGFLGGLSGLLSVPLWVPAVPFVAVVTGLMILLGTSSAIGIAISCASYLGIAECIAWLGRRDECSRRVAAIALLFMTFAPGGFLWATQPLKDIFFGAMLSVFIVLAVRWQDTINSGERVGSRLLTLGAISAIVMYFISGIRWYVALALIGALPVLCAASMLKSRRRLLVIVSLTLAAIGFIEESISTAPMETPAAIRAIFRPSRARHHLHVNAADALNAVRSGFDTDAGATAIQAGPFLQDPDTQSYVARLMTLPNFRSIPPAKREAVREQLLHAPHSPLRRLIAGLTAIFVPRTVGQALGLIRIGGGRGLWAFVEADTVVFDLLILWTVVTCTRNIRSSSTTATPPFFFVAASCLLVAVPLAYTVSNFATLFRLRYVLFSQLALLPLVMSDAPRSAGNSESIGQPRTSVA